MSTSRKVAIVTGASRGIGAAIAKRLAKDGFDVVVNYAGRAKEADEVVQAIEAEGGNAIAIQADVANYAAVAELFSKTKAHFGRIDALVNNAGIMPSTLPNLADTDDETFDRLFAGIRFDEIDGNLLFAIARDEDCASEIEDEFSHHLAVVATQVLKHSVDVVVVLPKVLQ